MLVLIGIIIAMVCAVAGLSAILVIKLLRDIVVGTFDLATKHKGKNG